MKKYDIQNPDFEHYIREKLKGQHFMHLIGFDLNKIVAGKVEGKMKLEQKHLQQFGFVHGGLSATLMDIVMGFAAYTLMPKGKGVVTVNLSADYINPGIGDYIRAVGEVEKAGGKLLFCQAQIFTGKAGIETEIASGRSIMAVIER